MSSVILSNYVFMYFICTDCIFISFLIIWCSLLQPLTVLKDLIFSDPLSYRKVGSATTYSFSSVSIVFICKFLHKFTRYHILAYFRACKMCHFLIGVTYLLWCVTVSSYFGSDKTLRLNAITIVSLVEMSKLYLPPVVHINCILLLTMTTLY